MQTFLMMSSGLACVALAMLTLYKLAPRDGAAPVAWLQKTGTEILVSVLIVMLASFGIALLLSGAAA